jgi:hypothetical protein
MLFGACVTTDSDGDGPSDSDGGGTNADGPTTSSGKSTTASLGVGGSGDGGAGSTSTTSSSGSGGAPPQEIHFQMQISPETYPLCGFSDTDGEEARGIYWERELVEGAGPNGDDVVQIEHLPVDHYHEYYNGWVWVDAPVVPQGETRYLRWKIKLVSPVVYDGVDGAWGEKFVIFGDGSRLPNPDASRVISNLRANIPSSENETFTEAMFRTELNIAGPPSRFDTDAIAPDVWHSFQLKVRSSATTESADGHLYMYVDGDNADETSPTYESSGDFQLDTSAWSAYLRLGAYGESLDAGGQVVYQIAAFEYASTFDPTWGG